MLGDICIQGGRSENEITDFQDLLENSSWAQESSPFFQVVLLWYSGKKKKKKNQRLLLSEVTTLSLVLIYKIIGLYF